MAEQEGPMSKDEKRDVKQGPVDSTIDDAVAMMSQALVILDSYNFSLSAARLDHAIVTIQDEMMALDRPSKLD
jgi:hypothetical protein